MHQSNYNSKLVSFSRSNRKKQTVYEKRLWYHLRGRIHGYKFRRQYPIDSFILDFYCVEKKLAIELDGSQHIQYYIYDKNRTVILESLGIQVLRFWDSEVLKDLNSVLEKILLKLTG